MKKTLCIFILIVYISSSFNVKNTMAAVEPCPENYSGSNCYKVTNPTYNQAVTVVPKKEVIRGEILKTTESGKQIMSDGISYVTGAIYTAVSSAKSGASGVWEAVGNFWDDTKRVLDVGKRAVQNVPDEVLERWENAYGEAKRSGANHMVLDPQDRVIIETAVTESLSDEGVVIEKQIPKVPVFKWAYYYAMEKENSEFKSNMYAISYWGYYVTVHSYTQAMGFGEGIYKRNDLELRVSSSKTEFTSIADYSYMSRSSSNYVDGDMHWVADGFKTIDNGTKAPYASSNWESLYSVQDIVPLDKAGFGSFDTAIPEIKQVNDKTYYDDGSKLVGIPDSSGETPSSIPKDIVVNEDGKQIMDDGSLSDSPVVPPDDIKEGEGSDSPSSSGGTGEDFPNPSDTGNRFSNLVTQKFPFSLPWDIMAMVSPLVAEPVRPELDLDKNYKLGSINVPIKIYHDFAWMDSFIVFFRTFIMIGFTIFLILSTRSLLGGAK